MTGPASAQTADEEAVPRVLLLYSDDRLLPANLRFDASFRDALGKVTGERYELFTEFLNAIRFSEEARQDAMAEALRVRYRECPPQVLVAGGGDALNFFLKRRDSLFPGTPLVFGGLGLRDKPAHWIVPDLAGVPMSVEIAPTLDLALRLRPKTREVIVITGSAEFDRQWEERARVDFEPFESRVKLTYWNDLPFAELTRRLSTLSPETVVFYLTYFLEPDGTPVRSPAYALELLAAKSTAPIFGPYDTYLGKGIVGGMMTDFAGEGAAVASLVQRVLAGETTAEIGIQAARPGVYQFDARQLKRWAIPERETPTGSVITFQTPTLWQEHPRMIIALIVFTLIQSALIAGLLIHRNRYFRSQAALAQSGRELVHLSRVSLLGELAGTLAHELNQPLTAILSNSQTGRHDLKGGKPDLPELAEILDDISADAKRAGNIIHGMKAMLKKDSQVAVTALDANEIVMQVLALLHSEIIFRKVAVVLKLDESIPPVMAGKVELQQVLINLIVNTLDMVTPEEGKAALTIATRYADGFAMISVQDSGPGIAHELLPRLFEPFFSTKQNGLGLGLAISRSIMINFGGTLLAENDPAGGAVFRMSLPVTSSKSPCPEG